MTTLKFSTFPHPGIQSLVPYEPGKSIESLQQELGLTDVIKLASNENPLGCGPLAKAALSAMDVHTLATYPSTRHHPLYKHLSEALGVPKEYLLLANGADALISLLMLTFALHTGRSMLTHQYAFNAYTIQAKTLGIPTQVVNDNPDLSVNIQRLIDACNAETAVLFLANPNNPTGFVLPEEDLKKLLTHLPPTTLLALDQAYCDYCPQPSTLDWIKTHPNLVILRTFSKIHGLAGLRIGYAIGHPEVISLLERSQLPFTVNRAAMNAALAALEDHAFIKQSLAVTRNGMIQLQQGFKQLNFMPYPSSGNFIMLDLKQDAKPIYEKLLRHGIIVRPLHAYGLNRQLRITIGTADQNEQLLKVLSE